MSESFNINELFNNAEKGGVLSGASKGTINVMDIGQKIEEAMGAGQIMAPASEMVLVTMLVDDSGSIKFGGNMKAVIEGHNMVLDALAKTPQKQNILAHTRYLNGYLLYPYSEIIKAERMNRKNYNPSLGTPLYDQAMTVLATVIARTQSFIDNGIPTRSVTLILTDGADAHSVSARDHDVAALVRSMLQAENHIVAAMGFTDGMGTDFRQVFRNMGIEEEWILTPGNSEHEIRQAFHIFSRSVVKASQPGISLKSLGGFAA